MADLDKSIELADKLIREIPNEVFDKLLSDIKCANNDCLTYDEYLIEVEKYLSVDKIIDRRICDELSGSKHE